MELVDTELVELTIVETPKQRFFRRTASVSVYIPLVALLIQISLLSFAKLSAALAWALALAYCVLPVIGFIAAFAGLCAIPWCGSEKILLRSVVGMVFNGLLLLMVGAVLSAGSSIRQAQARKTNENEALQREASLQMEKVVRKTKLTIAPPPWFNEHPEGRNSSAVIHSYIKGDPTDGQFDVYYTVEELAGTIEPGDHTKRTPNKPEETRLETAWQGLRVQVIRREEDIEGTKALTFDVQVPVSPKAIRVKLTGPRDREEDLKTDLEMVLQGIEGPTNWD